MTRFFLRCIGIFFLLTAPALAQSTVTVIGPITPGDCAAFNSTTVIKDSGGTGCTGSGAGVPGGTNGQIQYNNSGNFGGFTASGDATINTGTGAVAITANAVTNAKAAQMPANTIKGNNTGSTANAADLTGAQAEQILQFTQTGTGAVQSTVDVKLKNWIFASDFGAVGDGINTAKNVSTTSGGSTLTVSTAQFASTDCNTGTGCTGPVNKVIMVSGAGAAGAPYSGTITGFTSSTVVTVSGTFGTTLVSSSQIIAYGTDNAAKLQNWINRLQAAQGIGVLDPGQFAMATALSITTTVNIVGSGASSLLLLTTPTMDAIDINTNNPVYLSRLTINGSTAATAGNMISNTGPSGPGGNSGSEFRSLSITGGFRGYIDGSSDQLIIDSSVFNAQTGVGIQTANAIQCSAGNKFITNSTIDIPISGTYTAGLVVTDSGIIFSNNKINGGTGGSDIIIQPASTCTIPSDIIITDNSLEGDPTSCIQMGKGAFTGAAFPNIVISNNEVGCVGTNGIALGDGNTNWIKHVNITGNQLYGGSGGTALSMTNSVVDVSVTGNTFESAAGSTTGLSVSSTVTGTARGNTFDSSLTTNIGNSSPAFLAELSIGGHINYAGVAPTATSCGGTTTTVSGSTDASGSVVTGGSAAASCTITFAKTYANAPRCSAINAGGGSVVSSISASTAILVISYPSSTAQTLNWTCNGN